MKYTNNSEKLSISDAVESWVKETFKKYIEHPEQWPLTDETQVNGYPYWVELRILAAPHRGEGQWNFQISASYGSGANIEIYVTLTRGDKNNLIDYMAKELEKGAAETLFFIEDLCEKVDEKDDDYHSDFWDDY